VKIERAEGALQAPETEVVVTSALDEDTLSVRVTLVLPEEPMAWAIGTLEGDVFTSAWHAERGLGGKALRAAREAVVEPHSAQAVRVWGDDGSVTTRPIARSSR
jgi:hypothetical protein